MSANTALVIALAVLTAVILFLLWERHATAQEQRQERRSLLNSALANTPSEFRILQDATDPAPKVARDPLAVPALEGYDGPVGL